MVGYELSYEAEEIDSLLKSVDEKSIYDDASQESHGLMSSEDKAKLDKIGALSNDEIASIVNG